MSQMASRRWISQEEMCLSSGISWLCSHCSSDLSVHLFRHRLNGEVVSDTRPSEFAPCLRAERSLTFDLLLHVLKECLCAVDIQLTSA